MNPAWLMYRAGFFLFGGRAVMLADEPSALQLQLLSNFLNYFSAQL